MLKAQPSESLQKPWLSARKRHRLWKQVVVVARRLILVYLVVAYVALPMFCLRYMRHHPALAEIPNIMHAVDGITGSPLNEALSGARRQEELMASPAVHIDHAPRETRA